LTAARPIDHDRRMGIDDGIRVLLTEEISHRRWDVVRVFAA
jgi:hypothetical protein